MSYLRSLALALFGFALILVGMRDGIARGPVSAADSKADVSSTRSAHEPLTGTRPDGSVVDGGPTGNRERGMDIPRSGEPFPYSDTTRTTQSARKTRTASPEPSASPAAPTR